jgi:hypothetical protein
MMLACPRMKRLALALCCCVPVSAFAFTADIEPKQLHEECVKLEAGEKRTYYWKADNPVDFNVHYHEGPEVFYPVKRPGMRGDGGVFTAKVAQDYCWMWTARDKPVKLEGRIENK